MARRMNEDGRRFLFGRHVSFRIAVYTACLSVTLRSVLLSWLGSRLSPQHPASPPLPPPPSHGPPFIALGPR